MTTTLNANDASELIAGGATVVDVREPGEFKRCHIPGAINIPLSRLKNDPKSFQPTSDKVVLCCQRGVRAEEAYNALRDSCSANLVVLKGGMSEWLASALPTIEDKTAPIAMERQVQIVAGSLVLLGTILTLIFSNWFLMIPGFVGLGLVFAGITNTCGLAAILAKLPYNRAHSS